jgi:hypothetical protein
MFGRRKKWGMSIAGMGIGAGIGAGLMFVLDPAQGSRRRALIRDKAVRASHALNRGVQLVGRDAYNRARGLAAAVFGHFRSESVIDDVLVARIRSEMGRWFSHSHAIQVVAQNGVVYLSGPILASEERKLFKAVKKVSGVRRVENQLQTHDEPGAIPSLQGKEDRRRVSEFLQSKWAPWPRVVAGSAGAAAVAYGLKKGEAVGWSSAAAGALLLARAITNIELKKMTRVGNGHGHESVH